MKKVKELNNDIKNVRTKANHKTKDQKEKKQTVRICDRSFDMEKYGALLKRRFAHRGVHTDFPENSIPAFNEAIKNNLAIELDVHLSKDNKVVVFHDDFLFRMTGVKDYVRFKTLEELKELRLNDTEHTIPTLEETLKFVNGRVGILLEIKTAANTKKICKAVIEELKDYKGNIFIQSFNPFVLRYFYKHAPTYLRGQLSSFFVGQKLGFFKKVVIKKLMLKKFSHTDFVAYNIDNMPNKYIEKANLPILAYTIKTKEQFEKAKLVSNNQILDNIEVLK